MAKGWIGVDFDGTLVKKCRWHGENGGEIGEPIDLMVNRVKLWLEEGKEVRIVTARVARGWDRGSSQWLRITNWCEEHLDCALTITSEKDPQMIELWDDRAVQLEPDTGVPIDGARY